MQKKADVNSFSKNRQFDELVINTEVKNSKN